MVGWRERKKELTRQAIIRAALELFEQQGYPATSVAQIAEAGMVSPATFFTYFPSKEDVVFADQEDRTEAVAAELRNRRPGQTPRQLVRSALLEVLEIGLVEDDLQQKRGRVVLASPALRAAAARRLLESTSIWAEALVGSAPELSIVEAHAMIGGALGAGITVAGYSIDSGAENVSSNLREALDIALAEGDTTIEPA